MKKNKYLRILTEILMIFVISCAFEGLVFLYNNIINNYYSSKHYINNEKIILEKNEFQIIHEDGKYKLHVGNIKNKIYNVAMEMNEKNQDVYMLLYINGESKFIPKENADATKFKIYLKGGIDANEFEIVFPDSQIDINNVNKIVINDNLNYLPRVRFSWIRTFIIFIVIALIYAIYKIYKFSNEKEINFKKENVFLVFALVVGIILIITSAPQARYDEHAHYWRAYEILSGNIVSSTTHELPTSVINLFRLEDGNYPNRNFDYKILKEKLTEKLNPNIKEVFPVGATAGLTIISYVPQLIGMGIANLLNASPLVILWSGRFTNLVSYIVLIYLSIKIIPNEKWKKIIMLIGIFPMSLNLATTLSPDAIIISLTILTIAYALYLKFEVNEIKIWNIFILGILCAIPTLCKIVYFPLILTFFILPKNKFKNNLFRFIYFGIILVIMFVPYFEFKKIMSTGDSAIAIRSNMDEQILFTFSSIPRLILICINTFNSESINYFSEMIGGWNTPTILSIVIFIILIGIMYEENEEDKKYNFSVKDNIIFTVIILIEFSAVFAAMYIAWTQARQVIIEGVQGRYFLPILPLLSILLSRSKIKLSTKSKDVKFILGMVIIYFIVIGYTVKTYLKI